MRTVAVLFAESQGVYATQPCVDLWTVERDARKYSGPFPVVAHPPCNRWINLACVNYARYGGEHNKPDNDGGCFEAALDSVRTFGGVLEHPADSRAFRHHAVPIPDGPGWQKTICNAFVCEVWQSAYGHRANKRTWLYYVGPTPHDLRWNRPRGTHQVAKDCSLPNQRPQLTSKEANATPLEFAREMLKLARLSVALGELA